jgi:glycosyltransferase involved in cell wall biosynthesis
MEKLVSIVIPTYNRCRYLVEAVECVLAQTYEPIEVIVVDDGSTDGTAAAMERFVGRAQYLTQENQGPSAARNLGIGHSTGEYIAFLDSDDLWAPTKVEKQVAILERSPQVGVVFCEALRLDCQTGETRARPVGAEMRGDLRRKLLRRNCITGSASAAMVRRACFEKVGVFDEALRSAEDWDMWIRLSRECHFDFVPERLVTLRNHGGNLHKKIELMHDHQRRVLERAFEGDPVDRGNRWLRRRSLADIHFDAGDEYYAAGQYRNALRHLAQSVTLWPFDRRYYTYAARALLKPVISLGG